MFTVRTKLVPGRTRRADRWLGEVVTDAGTEREKVWFSTGLCKSARVAFEVAETFARTRGSTRLVESAPGWWEQETS